MEAEGTVGMADNRVRATEIGLQRKASKYKHKQEFDWYLGVGLGFFGVRDTWKSASIGLDPDIVETTKQSQDNRQTR